MTDRETLQLINALVSSQLGTAPAVTTPGPVSTQPREYVPTPAGPAPQAATGNILDGAHVEFYASHPGEVRDFHFTPMRSHLSVNVNPEPGGVGQMTDTEATLLDAAGNPLPGYNWPLPSLGDGVISFQWDFTPGASYILRVRLVGGGAASVQVMG